MREHALVESIQPCVDVLLLEGTVTLGRVDSAMVISEGLSIQGLRPEEVDVISRLHVGDRFDEPLAICFVLNPGEDCALVVVVVVELVDIQGLRPVFVRPLSVFVSWWLNTVDAERKRNDHSVDGTKTALRNVERSFHRESRK